MPTHTIRQSHISLYQMYAYTYDGLVQDGSIPIALAMVILRSCTTPSIYASKWVYMSLSTWFWTFITYISI